MRIKLFIVTYRRREKLAATLTSLFACKGSEILEVCIINNHSEFALDPQHEKKISKVYHNQTRPDFSTGHLARNWNQAIILGIENLRNPACDLLITCQDDVEFQTTWLDKVMEWSSRYTFMQFGAGDELCVYRPAAVAQVGVWDERFCNIGFQEADYFLRSVMHNGDHCSINDFFHGRLWNQLDPEQSEGLVVRRLPGATKYENSRADPAYAASSAFNNYSRYVFKEKYGRKWRLLCDQWPRDVNRLAPRGFRIATYPMYPYFEKDIINPSLIGYGDMRGMWMSPSAILKVEAGRIWQRAKAAVNGLLSRSSK